VLAISDRTYLLGGEVRMAGTPAELAASPDFVESFLGGDGVTPRPVRTGVTGSPASQLPPAAYRRTIG
jgi:hypothetical protein